MVRKKNKEKERVKEHEDRKEREETLRTQRGETSIPQRYLSIWVDFSCCTCWISFTSVCMSWISCASECLFVLNSGSFLCLGLLTRFIRKNKRKLDFRLISSEAAESVADRLARLSSSIQELQKDVTDAQKVWKGWVWMRGQRRLVVSFLFVSAIWR